MKNYPRIHSLSTLGIRHHQAFNYEFHPSRTDFVGDSGCGKSLIADLLQLIFVGSEYFKSATESAYRRDVDGMVLRTEQGKGTEIGYAFVNIELAKGQFLIVGAYLESSSKSSKSFIINATHDESKLVPLNSQWVMENISENGQIPTLEELGDIAEKQDAVLHLFNARKKFHAYLFRHEILPHDLASSNQLLGNYSTIIQSFSRGRNLDVKKSESLKKFLFGDDKTKEIHEKYRIAVDELKGALNEFNRNSAEISLSTRKHKALFKLKELKDDLVTKEKIWLNKQCAFRRQIEQECLTKLKEVVLESIYSYEHLLSLSAVVSNDLSIKDITIEAWQAKVDVVKIAYDEISLKYRSLERMTALLQKYQCSIDELILLYTDYETQKVDAAVFMVFKPLILENNLEYLIEQLQELSLLEIVNFIDQQIHELTSLAEQKKVYLSFTNIDNKGSFGSWAIRMGKQLSWEIESIVMHYKDIPVQVELAEKQYISSPEAFIACPEITNRDSVGFWLSIGEFRQYIAYVSNRLFIDDNIEQLSDILQRIGKDVQREIDLLEKKKTDLDKLKLIALKEGFINFLRAYKNREAIQSFQVDELLEISIDQFQEGLSLLNERDYIEKEYHRIYADWKEQIKEFNKYQQYIASIEESKIELDKLTSLVHWNKEADSIIQKIKPYLELPNDYSQTISNKLDKRFAGADNKGQIVREVLQDNKSKLNTLIVVNQYNYYSTALEKTVEAFRFARITLAKEPDISEWKYTCLQEPKTEEQDFRISETLYIKEFDQIVNEYAKGDEFKFSSSRDFVELCGSILPDAFRSNIVEEETAIDTIERYLNTINEKNKNLNKRKLQKIREILDEVIDEVNSRLNTVREIHNFLNHEKSEITGGQRVHLRSNQSLAFPQSWMEIFIQRLNDDDTLFNLGPSVNELLMDSTSLDEKMIHAFQIFTEYKRTKPKVEELLDPSRYFDLTFTMESHITGKTNSGSTGQTYAAIALLCIARLSLVNRSSASKIAKGIRFMPIDEAEGLGSNFDMLYEIAKQYDYQIITMSINPLGKYANGQQYIYMLSNNKLAGEGLNFTPFAIFHESDMTEFNKS